MKNFADLLQAIASLLWPLIVAVTLFSYRKELKNLLQRIKRGKFLGQEVELGEALDSLEKKALSAAAEVPLLTPAPSEKPQRIRNEMKLPPREPSDPIEDVLNTAKSNPIVGLMILSDLIEHELREIIFSQGQVDRPYIFTPSSSLDILEKRSLLTQSMLSALREFYIAKVSIIHNRDQVSEGDIFRAIDSGITILQAVWSIPRGVYFVHKHGVKVYSDPECKRPRPDVNGVVLAMGDKDKPAALHIYPTTRTDYEEGMQVAWEWSSKNSWGDTWYRDPDTGVIKHAWSDSMEFVGRPLYST